MIAYVGLSSCVLDWVLVGLNGLISNHVLVRFGDYWYGCGISGCYKGENSIVSERPWLVQSSCYRAAMESGRADKMLA